MTGLMILRKAIAGAVFGAFAIFALVGAPTAAKADCHVFPRVALWQGLDHDFVRNHVAERYDGDWGAYLTKMKRYRDKLAAIHEQGLRAGVTWRGKKVRLEGAKLGDFLKLVDRRLAVTKCLAESEGLANFSTAAGGEPPLDDRRTRGSGSCGAIPDVEWWALKSHDDIVKYVRQRHDGDFRDYVAKWDDRLRKLQDIYARGSAAITRSGLMLRGPSLHAYMVQMRERNNVVRCLASVYGGTRS